TCNQRSPHARFPPNRKTVNAKPRRSNRRVSAVNAAVPPTAWRPDGAATRRGPSRDILQTELWRAALSELDMVRCDAVDHDVCVVRRVVVAEHARPRSLIRVCHGHSVRVEHRVTASRTTVVVTVVSVRACREVVNLDV